MLDLLAVLGWAAAEGLGDGRPVRLDGAGAAGPLVLHAAALDARIGDLHLDPPPVSWSTRVQASVHRRQLASAVPGALRHYDLPDLIVAVAPRTVEIRRQD